MTLVPLSQVLGVSTDELLGVQGGMGTGGFEASGTMEAGEHAESNTEPITESNAEAKGTADGSPIREPNRFQSLLVVPAAEDGTRAIREFTVSAGACAAVIQYGSDFGLETEGIRTVKSSVRYRMEPGRYVTLQIKIYCGSGGTHFQREDDSYHSKGII